VNTVHTSSETSNISRWTCTSTSSMQGSDNCSIWSISWWTCRITWSGINTQR